MDPDHPSPVRDASVHTAARGTNKSLAFHKDGVSWTGHNIKTGVAGVFFFLSFFSYQETFFFSSQKAIHYINFLKSNTADIRKIKNTINFILINLIHFPS